MDLAERLDDEYIAFNEACAIAPKCKLGISLPCSLEPCTECKFLVKEKP